MRITVNGKEVDAADGVTLAGLLESLGLSQRRVAVELNRTIIGAGEYADTVLNEGDVLEVLSFVGGG